MNEPIVDDWITTSGLTERECAMIQPTYDYWGSNGTDCACLDSLDAHDHCSPTKQYDTNAQIYQDGSFCEGKLCCGKLYVYDEDGLLERIEVYKEGAYVSEGVIEE